MTGADGASFAVQLRRLREERSLTQEELAERAGVTVKAVGALERGERTRPYPHTVRSLADALGLDEAGRAALVASVPARGRAQGASVVPAPPSPLIGRESEVAALGDLLRSGSTRLVTLTGPGGVGKTRLALELLNRERSGFPGGAAFVELADLRDPGLLATRIAAALGVPETAGLEQALAGRRVMIVLDNLEHLLPAAPAVADLVARCAELVVLVTSRAPLRVRAEHEIVLAPLAVPAGDAPAEVVASPAAQLFLDRTTAAGVPLEVDADNAAAIATICRNLDGLPLAVELAAAGARLLTPTALVSRLDRLAPGPRDVTERQRTIEGAVAWSLDLLEPEEIGLFDALSVFAGGFTIEAAEAVAGEDVVAPLSVLLEQSLVARTDAPDELPRFRMLEPVRQHAARRLTESGRDATIAAAHARFFHERAVAAGPLLHGGAELRIELDRLDADHANLQAAYQRLLDGGRVGDAAELAGSLWLYLALRGHAREGLGWLDLLDGGAGDVARCRALTGRLGLQLLTGDVAGMRALEEAPVLARRVPDAALAAECLSLAGHGAIFGGDPDAARVLVEDALSLAERAGAAWPRAHALLALGQLTLVEGRYDDADHQLGKAVAVARELGNPFTLATALNTLATLTAVRGEDERTAVLLAEAVALSVDARLGWTLSYALPVLAGVAVRLGDPATAATLFGASATLAADDAVDPRFPVTRELADRDLAGAREQLGGEAFREAWDLGRSATPGEVAALAAALTQRVRG